MDLRSLQGKEHGFAKVLLSGPVARRALGVVLSPALGISFTGDVIPQPS